MRKRKLGKRPSPTVSKVSNALRSRPRNRPRISELLQRQPRALALLANPSLRAGPSSPLLKFVREFEPYLSHVAGLRIYALEGSLRAILRGGLLHDHPYLYNVPAGFAGGIVILTAMVVRESSSVSSGSPPPGPDRDTVDAVIYMIDPTDATSLFPESLALKRECVVVGLDQNRAEVRTFIPTYNGAREWTTLQWYNSDHPTVRQFFLDVNTVRKIFSLPDLPARWKPLMRQTIALIAHDKNKALMLQFARENMDLLCKFECRLATGTTGDLLNLKVPKRLPRSKWDAKLKQEFDRLARTVHKKGISCPWICAQPSGPRGGDVQIASAVLRGECQKVIFFEDPHVAREHEADIGLLERTSRILGRDITCLHDYKSASQWAKKLLAVGDLEPLTLVHAFRLVFGVELVLADDPLQTAVLQGDELWGMIVLKAAWYLAGLVKEESRVKAKTTDDVVLTITWGHAMHELVATTERLPAHLCNLEGRFAQQGLDVSTRPLASPEFFRAPNLRVIPLVGIMGATDPRVEANENARRLAAFFGGKREFVADYAFYEIGEEGPAVQVAEGTRWPALDIAVFTCEVVKEVFGKKAVAPVPGGLYSQMRQAAAGEIGGLYFDSCGNVIPPRGYIRNGVPYEALKSVAAKGGSILLAGVQQHRRSPALAALRARVASIIITDREFAYSLLQDELTSGRGNGTPARSHPDRRMGRQRASRRTGRRK